MLSGGSSMSGAIDTTSLWGEFTEGPSASNSSVGLTPAEKEQLTRLPRPLPLEGPRIHQPGTSGAGGGSGGGPGGTDNNSCPTPLVILPFNQTSPRDPYVIHTLHLLNYLDQLKTYLTGGGSGVPPPPTQLTEPLPVGARATRGPSQGPFSKWVSSESSRLSARRTSAKGGHEDVKPDLEASSNLPLPSQESVRQILHKSTASLAAFSGFDVATDSALAVLTDAAAEFMRNLCSKMLRSSRDNALASLHGDAKSDCWKGSGRGFADVMDRTLTEVQGGAGLGELVTYYQHGVVNRYWGVLTQCRAALKECHQMAQMETAFPNMVAGAVADGGISTEPLGTPASVAGPTTGATSGVKEEDHNPESDNIPEIHFPSSESGDGSGAGVAIGFSTVDALTAPSSQMETGLQMLVSLEGEQQEAQAAAAASSGETESAVPGGSLAGLRPPSLIIPPGSVITGGITYHEQQDQGSPVVQVQQTQQPHTTAPGSARKRKQT